MTFSPLLIWFLVGVGFLLAEFFVPGFVLIFFAAGSWIAALVVWAFDIGATCQILIFIVSSLILLFTLRKISLKTFKGVTLDNVDDNYANSMIGKTALVTKTITPNVAGEIKVMGTFWRGVADTTIEEGESVIIESRVSEDGLTYKVRLIQ